MATLPVPPGWKPSPKKEILTWLDNLEIQLGSVLKALPEDSDVSAQVYVALAITAHIEELVNAAP